MHALLNPRLKLWLHIVEVCFILPIIILTVVRVTMGMSFSGGGRMGLAFVSFIKEVQLCKSRSIY